MTAASAADHTPPSPSSVPPAAARQPVALTEAQLRGLLSIHRRAMQLRNLEQERTQAAGPDPRYTALLAVKASQPLPEVLPRVYYAVSNLCRPRQRNSIDRVALSLMAELRGLGLRLVPAAFDGQAWCEARPAPPQDDPLAARFQSTGRPISPDPGDHFVEVTLDYLLPLAAYRQLATMRSRGLNVSAFVHDLFALSRPEWFPMSEILDFDRWLRRTLTTADRLLCPSQHAAGQLMRWLGPTAARPSSGARRRLSIAAVHLGGNAFDANGPAPIWPATGTAQGFELPQDDAPLFLTIAAIHMRKGIDTLVNAFTALWDRGVDLRLVLSGRPVDARLVAQIEAHPKFGDRLLYPGFLGDAQLVELAWRAQALIVPSRDEGFGLPMAEAAGLGLPAIARDIPVFREIAGNQPFWFGAGAGPANALGARLLEWLRLSPQARRQHVPWQAARPWADSARELAAVLFTGIELSSLQLPNLDTEHILTKK